MPRYYFDIDVGEELLPDEDGVQFATVEEAKVEAVGTLPALARDMLAGTEDLTLVVVLRTEQHKVLLRATLSVVVEEFG